MTDFFEWNGQKSTDYGIHITDQPGVIIASERAAFTQVPARSGTLTQLEADMVYDDIVLSVDCCVSDLMRIHEIGAWLRGAGKLVLPEQPGGYYEARVANQIEFVKVLRGRPNRTLTVTFRCHPFWYLADVPDIELTTSSAFIENPGSVASEPVVTVYGSGDIALMVGQQIVELEGVEGSIALDSPLGEAYSGDDSQNHRMIGDFFAIPPGTSPVSWSGSVTKVVIRPNWRYLL